MVESEVETPYFCVRMRRPGLLLLVVLLLSNLDGADAFTTKKSDRKHHTFSGTEASSGSKTEVHAKRPQQPAFVGPPHPQQQQQQQQQVAEYYEYSWLEDDDEMEISITTALVSCVLTMALGFGIGYGT